MVNDAKSIEDRGGAELWRWVPHDRAGVILVHPRPVAPSPIPGVSQVGIPLPIAAQLPIHLLGGAPHGVRCLLGRRYKRDALFGLLHRNPAGEFGSSRAIHERLAGGGWRLPARVIPALDPLDGGMFASRPQREAISERDGKTEIRSHTNRPPHTHTRSGAVLGEPGRSTRRSGMAPGSGACRKTPIPRPRRSPGAPSKTQMAKVSQRLASCPRAGTVGHLGQTRLPPGFLGCRRPPTPTQVATLPRLAT